MSTHTYSVTSDTASGVIDMDSLKTAVEAAAIAPNLISFYRAGDAITLSFDATLSGAEITTLDGLVSAHTGVPVVRGTMVRLSDGTICEATGLSQGKITWTEVS
jgi:hypothetical protein